MRLNTFLTTFFLFLNILLFSQTAVFDWAGGIGASGNDRGQSISTDSLGNVYVAGYFRGTTDFNPGTGVFNKTAVGGADIFVQKLDSSGAFLWVKTFGSSSDDMALGVTSDGVGNVYLTGDFRGTIDFDPGVGIYNLTSLGDRDVFILKLSSTGNFKWVGRIGDSNVDGARRILVDNSNDLIISGWFSGTADFDIGAGVSSHTSNGSRDIFILKMDTSGSYLWSKSFGSALFDVGFGITNDLDGNIYQTGLFEGTVDFDPTGNILNLTSNGGRDIFICKYSSSGTFLWAKKIGGSGHDSGNFIDTDDNGNLYVHGQYSGTVDFDPSSNVSNFTSAGSYDAYLLKIDGMGNFKWVVSLGGSSDDLGQGIRVDRVGNSYVTGSFKNTVDFDPSSSVSSLTSLGGKDAYIAKYSSTGNFIWAQQFGGSSNATGKAVDFDKFGYLLETGWFEGTVDFNSGTGVFNKTAVGEEDVFVTRFRVCYPTSSFITVSGCSPYISPSGNHTWLNSGIYTDVMSNSMGCDSIITVLLTVRNIDTAVTQSGSELTAVAVGYSYQWVDCANSMTPIAGATNRVFVPSQNGNYAVEIYDSVCLVTSDCRTVVVIGIEESELVDVLVYPNPVVDNLVIENKNLGELTIAIFDNSGKQIYTSRTHSRIVEIDFSKFATGVYVVKVNSGSKVLAKKIVKR